MAKCDGFGALGSPLECGVKAATDGALENMAMKFMESYDAFLKDFMTSWLGKGVTVDLTGVSVEWFKLTSSVMTVFLVTLGLMIAGIKVIRSKNGKPAREVFESLARVVFVSTAGAIIVQVFLAGGDAYGKWILDKAGLDAQTFTVVTAATTGFPGIGLILGFFGILTVLCQWALMFIRGALLPVLVGFWPITAAMNMLDGEGKAFERLTRWIIAFVIYSPIAASIYALAWRMKGGDDGLGGVVNGWILIVMAVLALPAIMRLVAPAASAVGKMAGGVMAAGITAAVVGGGIAVGAAVASGGASAGAGAAAKAGSSGGQAAGKGGGGGGSPAGGGQKAIGGGGSGGSSPLALEGGGGGGSPAGGGKDSQSSSSGSGSSSGGQGNSGQAQGSPASSGGSGSGSSSGGQGNSGQAQGSPASSGGGRSPGSGRHSQGQAASGSGTSAAAGSSKSSGAKGNQAKRGEGGWKAAEGVAEKAKGSGTAEGMIDDE